MKRKLFLLFLFLNVSCFKFKKTTPVTNVINTTKTELVIVKEETKKIKIKYKQKITIQPECKIDEVEKSILKIEEKIYNIDTLIHTSENLYLHEINTLNSKVTFWKNKFFYCFFISIVFILFLFKNKIFNLFHF